MKGRLIFVLAVAILAVLPVYSQGNIDSKAELAALKKLETQQQSAKAAYIKSPKDAKKKSAYVTLTLALANNVQASMALGSKEKYPKALRLYREVLKVDPKNKEADTNRNRIEAIYKSMGRPIPK